MRDPVDYFVPPSFGEAWRAAHRAALAAVPGAAGSDGIVWAAIGSECAAVREPHIEELGDEVRYTWNRDGHYLEVGVFADGRVEWFYGPRQGFRRGGCEGLDDRFYAALRASHATPARGEGDNKEGGR